jgi:hypothetical protein
MAAMTIRVADYLNDLKHEGTKSTKTHEGLRDRPERSSRTRIRLPSCVLVAFVASCFRPIQEVFA